MSTIPTNKTWNIDIDDKLNYLESQRQSLWWELEGKDINTGASIKNKLSLTQIRDKLNGIEEGANKYILPVASKTVLGGVKVDDTTITIKNSVITANNVQHAFNADYASKIDCPDTGIGSSVKPIYVDGDGNLLASNSTVGSSSTPVFLDNGTITQVTTINASLVTGTLSGTVVVPANKISGTVANASQVTSVASNKTEIINMIYPVGSIYMSLVDTSPASLFGVGTWMKLENRFLLGASTSHALNTTGGSETVTLDVSQIPAHSHVGSTAGAGEHTPSGSISGGSHSHSGTTSNNGDHVHHKGSMNITGSFLADDSQLIEGMDGYGHAPRGAFYTQSITGHYDFESDDDDFNGGWMGFDASRTWSGYTSSPLHPKQYTSLANHNHTFTTSSVNVSPKFTGNKVNNHSHTVTVENTGGSKSHDNMPPYLAVYMWKRTK